MADIATLGIKVTTEGVAQASSDLDKLGRSGANAAVGAQKVVPAMDKAAVSAKQLQFATRQLPAQFTDIFTGLASGQAPLQVLIQQGGQLKDTFGGVGPALRASVGYIAGLINPITLVAGAVAGLGLAWKQQQDRLDEFNISLAKTNNFIGLTAQQLAEFTAEIDAAGDATAGAATETVNRIVAGGRLTQEQFRLISQSVAEFSSLTGESIDSIVKKYEDLARDPLDALLKLNESERFLTRAQYDRVKALQEEGRQQDAATEAIRIYAENMDRATQQVRGNLSEIAKLWIDVKNAASGAWQEIGNVADAIAGVTRRQAEANTRLIAGLAASARNLSYPGMLGAATGYVRNIPNVLRRPSADFSDVSTRVLSGSQVVDSAAVRAQQQAEEAFDRLRVSNLSKAAKLEEEIADIRKKGLAAGKEESEIQKAIADARARYKESLPKGPKGTDYSASILAQLRQQIALNEEQARSEENLSASQRLRVRILEQLDALGGKVTASQRAQIKAELEALESSDARAQAMQAEKRLKEDLLRLNNQLAASEANRARANQADLMAIGRGGDAVERARRALDIEREYEDGLRALRDRGIAEDSDSYRQQEAALRASRDRMLDMERDYYAQRDAMQADWKNGAVRAFEDYMAEANDVAGRTAEAIDGVLNSLQGTFEEFFRTGKLDWKGFLDDINAELARFFSQQLVKQLLSSFGGGAQSGAMASGGASSGIDWAGIIGSFFGGGRASGGPVLKGRLYEVGERGPELLQSGGRNFMIPGRDGYVQPNSAMQPAGGDLYQSITVQGRLDRRSVDQLAAESMRRQNLSRRRTG
ncbi:MAG: phage tail tape measure protein [Pseudoxanthomonas sp.]|nr:MAG: phage tail tape measure protein [Pseudoxanthomonas sp.]